MRKSGRLYLKKITALNVDRESALLEFQSWKAANGVTAADQAPITHVVTGDPKALILDFNSKGDCEGDDDIEIPQFSHIQEELATQEEQEISGGSGAFGASQFDFIPFTHEMLPSAVFHATTHDPHYFR
ncbi:hypothetical protein WAI453_006503 [Rhynchosporium graminicola]